MPDVPEVFVTDDRTMLHKQEAEVDVAKQMFTQVTEAVALSMLQPLVSHESSYHWCGYNCMLFEGVG